MELAHAGDDRLAGLLVGVGLEGRVFFSQTQQAENHLLLTGLGLRLDGDLNNRLRELHLLKDDLVLVVAQGVAGRGVLEADNAADLAGVNLGDFLALVGVHLEQTADALTLALRGVEHVAARADVAGVDADEAQLADERVGHDLEGQRGERRFVAHRALDFLVGVRVEALDRRDIQRRRHVVDDGVEQELNALVAVRGAAQHSEEAAIDGALADGGLHLFDGRLFAFHELLHDAVVHVGQRFDELLAVHLSIFHHIFRNRLVAVILAQVIVVDLGAHGQQVDNAAEIVLRADRQLNRMRIRVQTLVEHVHHAVEVRAHDVHLVDVHHARNMIVLGLTPDRLGLRLNAALRAEHGDRAVQHAEGTLDLDGKIDVAGSVDDVETIVLPVAGRRGRGDGDAALLLLSHPVHGGGAFMRLADLAVLARIEQNTLGRRRLAGIDMRHDTDVANHL